MKDFLKKQRELVAILVYVCIIAASIYLVIFPLLSKISGVVDQIQEEKLKQEIVGQRLNELPKMQQQYSILQKDEGLMDILLDRNNAVVLIEKLEKLAQDSGNKIEISISNNPVQKNTQPVREKNANDNALVNALPSDNYLQIKILLTGSYSSAVTFIQALESFEYYGDIIGIQINKSDLAANPIYKTGNSDPFGFVSGSSGGKISNNANVGDIETSLDVVFYTK